MTNIYTVNNNTTKGESVMNKFKSIVGKGWELAKQGTKKVASFAKKHATKIVAGVAGAIVGGIVSSTIGMAAVVGVGAAAIIMALTKIIVARVQKKALNKKSFMVDVMGAALAGGVVPYLAVYGMYYLVLAMYQLTLVAFKVCIYTLILFLI
jgi:hypothetical protein